MDILLDTEVKRVLTTLTGEPHAARNTAPLYLSVELGLRIKEIGALSIGDVQDGQNTFDLGQPAAPRLLDSP